MPLSLALSNVPLTNRCPHCAHGHVKMGRWFLTIARYRCPSCQREVRMTYDAKVKLFDAHAHLVR